MWEDLVDFMTEVGFPIVVTCVILGVVFTVFALPIAWFDGHAKTAYLKQTQNIDIPWYQATWLNVQVNSVDANIKQNETKNN